MSLLMLRGPILAQGGAALPPGPPPDEPVRFDTTRVPPAYDLVLDDTGYARTGASNDYRRWLQSDKVLGLTDKNAAPVKWYWEIALTNGASEMTGYLGVVEASWWDNYNGNDNPLGGGSLGYAGAGTIWGNGTTSQRTGLETYGAGDVVMLAFTPATGAFWVGVNGVWDRDPETETASATSHTPGAEFRISAQGRNVGDAGILRSFVSQFSYSIPDGFIPIGTPNPQLDTLLARSLGGYAILGRRAGVMNTRHLNAYLIVEDGTP